jgi:hypothetical protein
MTALRAAQRYDRRGFAVVSIPYGKKSPVLEGWEILRLTSEELPKHFNGQPQNVGLLLGNPSGGLVDVDLDTREAAKVVGRFLPPTLTSGRESSPHSHWWYVSPDTKTTRFKDVNGEVLVEVRSTGTQTLVAPSVHPSGERVVWHDTGPEFTEAEAGELLERVRQLATATLIARHIPPAGGRHDFALALAGFLLRPGRLSAEAVLKLVRAAWACRLGVPPGRAAWHASGADSKEVLRDLEGIVHDTAENLAAGEPVVGGRTLEEYVPGMTKLLCKWWGWSREAQHGNEPGEAEERKPTQAELFVRIADGAEFFHTPEGDAYARIQVGDHYETHLVRSKGLRRWLVRAFYEQFDRPPGAQALQDALGLLEARAHFDGPELDVCVRVAEYVGAIYVDLANERWEAVEITADGWRVVSEPPVRFRRPRGMLPLPVPERGGTVGELRRFVNVTDEVGWRLMVAWLVQALKPTGPYPVLLLQGELGSAKSTAERLLRALVDPSAAPLRTTPRNEHYLFIAATSAWVVAFDNISTLQPWLSDALCRPSTGGGFSSRTLYENREQELFDATRPLSLNGITDVATRPDLLDRSLIVSLPHIPEEDRKPEAELWAAFDNARPSILGALFDAVSGALGAVSSLRLERMPRMADFALWATAAESALGWDAGAFMDAYTGNRKEATERALEADPVAVTVRSLMQDSEEWTGTAGELWKTLGDLVDEDIRHTKDWPGAPNALSGKLKRLAPALRDIGVEYGEERAPDNTRRRLKYLRMNIDAKDRPYRPTTQETPANGGVSGRTISEVAPAKTVRQETPANDHISDDTDGLDNNLQPHSKQGHWQGDPMRHYWRGGEA